MAFRDSALKTTMLTNLTLALLGIVSSVLTARGLGPPGRGTVLAVTAWPLAMMNLGGFGIGEALVYWAGRRRYGLWQVSCAGLAVGFLQVVVLWTIGLLILPRALAAHGPLAVRLSLLYMLIFIHTFLGDYVMCVMRGTLSFFSWNLMRLINPVGYIGALLVLMLSHRLTVPNVVVAMLVGPTATTAAALRVFLRARDGAFQVSRSVVSDLLRYGVGTSISSVPQVSRDNLEQVVLAAQLSAVNLGLYAVAFATASLLQVFLAGFQIVIFPKTANNRDSNDAKTALVADLRVGVWTCLVFLAGYWLLAPMAIRLTYGAAYEGSISTSQLLSVAVFFLGVSQMFGAGLRGLGKPYLPAIGNLAGLLVELMFLLLLVPSRGLIGAAVSAVIGAWVNMALMAWIVHRAARFPFSTLLVPPTSRFVRLLMPNLRAEPKQA